LAARSPNVSFSRAVELLNAGDVARAEQICRDLLARNRRDHQALAVLGQIATMTSRPDEAAKLLGQCVTLAPRDVGYHVLLAEALATAGQPEAALARYDKALQLQADHAPALAGRANVLARQRRWDEARALLEPFVAAGAEDAGMAIVYARVAVHDRDYGRAVEVASRHLRDQTGEEIQRSLWFDIGTAHERAGDYDRAFEAYTNGKQIRLRPWDAVGATQRHDQLQAVFDRQTVEGLPRPSETSALPIFIAGMARSGSTLIEQIIDAHPQAFGAGEIPDLAQLLAELNLRIGSTLPYPECVRDLDQADVDDLQQGARQLPASGARGGGLSRGPHHPQPARSAGHLPLVLRAKVRAGLSRLLGGTAPPGHGVQRLPGPDGALAPDRRPDAGGRLRGPRREPGGGLTEDHRVLRAALG
jgi:tetratricopeptide (TPR) repeat protein